MCKNINCPNCFSKNLYRYGKDKKKQQKYLCRDCNKQFSVNSKITKDSNLNYPKCPICNSGTFKHHDYAHYTRFKCNSKLCNHVQVVLKHSTFKDEISNFIPKKINFKKLKTNINIVIDALYMYFIGSSSTRAIAKFLWDRKNFKISHVSIYNWIKGFGSVFKEISKKYLPKNLSDSDEWHVDETLIKIQAQKYYIWTVIDAETRFVIDWYLTTSRATTSAFHLFDKIKNMHGSTSTIVSDRLPSYTIPTKIIFSESKHTKVESLWSETNNNLIESFFKTFKHKYKTCHGLKSYESVKNFLDGFFFFYNYVKPHSNLNNETPARVAGVEYTELQRKNLLLF